MGSGPGAPRWRRQPAAEPLAVGAQPLEGPLVLGCLAVMEPGVAAVTGRLIVVEPRLSVVDAAAMVQQIVGSWLPLAVVEGARTEE